MWVGNALGPIPSPLACQQTERSDPVMFGACAAAQRGLVAAGLGRVPACNDKAPPSDPGLRRHRSSLCGSDDRAVPFSTHISSISMPSCFCPAVSCSPLQLLGHTLHPHPTLSHYGELYLSTALFTQLLNSLFQDCHLIPVN